MTNLRAVAVNGHGWDSWKGYECEDGSNTIKQWDAWDCLQPSERGSGTPQGNSCSDTVDSSRHSTKENIVAYSSGPGCETACETSQYEKASMAVIHGGCWEGYKSGSDITTVQLVDSSSNDEFEEDMDDDLSDDFDSDASPKTHDTRKRSKWFKMFFESWDTLSLDHINKPTRRWRCPACQNGPGSIAWYKGLQSLISHAKTKGSRRIRLHREFAELLEVEVSIRGIPVILEGETFGQWMGLLGERADHDDIIWPPMVVVLNTVLEKDESDKWIGMGSQELLDYFPSYAAVKARHAYGPCGHRGISILIFEASGAGYMEAQCLHKHFADEGKGREAWEHHGVIFGPGGKRQLYGFLACKEDLTRFNQHSHGRSQLKFEMRSYQEVIVCPLRQSNDDSRQLVRLKDKVAELQRNSNALEGTLQVLEQKLHKTMKENMSLKLKMKMQHNKSKEEIEKSLKERMDEAHSTTEEQEMISEILLRKKHAKYPHRNVGQEIPGEPDDAKVVSNLVQGLERIGVESAGLECAHKDCVPRPTTISLD